MLHVIHGFTEDDQSWQEVFAGSPLAARCHLLPGHGWTPCPPATTVRSFARELAQKLSDDGSDDLLGYSLGGRVALRLALDHPQRVRRLVLISCRPGIADPAARAARHKRDSHLTEMLEEDGLGSFVSWWERQPTLAPGRVVPRATVEYVRARRLSQDPLALAASLRCLGQGNMEPLHERLVELTMPVLLICGQTDSAYVADMRAMHDHIPAAQLEIMANCGHAVHRENRDDLLALLTGFLDAKATT